ncbi:hypothetical protein [uncultured Aquimarina sp.]|uniref:hypothetical protein n=1 Tax=uncultured Aquimarina sp. TaxID=575652 RepID=UPI002622FA30|nr:hypothetical protein [uncultured Aquimarina sp.]
MKSRKWIKYISLVGLLILLGYIFILFQYGSIDIQGTINTEYHKIENSSDRIIETDFFKLRAPSNWIHIYGGYGIEGHSYGVFQTNKGVIHYEYGPFTPLYDNDNEIYEYKVEKKNINRFRINIAKNKQGEIGICIPFQNEMRNSLTLYMSKSVSNNLDEIIKGIRELEFK